MYDISVTQMEAGGEGVGGAGDRLRESTIKITPTGVSFYRLGWTTQEGLRIVDRL